MQIKLNLRMNFAEMLLSAYLLSIFLGQLLLNNEQIAILIPLLIGCICFVYVMIYHGGDRVVIKWIGMSVLLSVLMLISQLYNSNSRPYNIIYIWGRVGAALLMYYGNIRGRTVKRIFYIVSVSFLIMALTGVQARDVLLGSSRNGINGLVIFFALVVYLTYESSNGELPYSYALIVLLVSIWSEGRSGILTTAFLIAFIFVHNFIFIKKGKLRTLLLFAFLAIVALLFAQRYFSDFIYQIEDRFQTRGFASLRFDVWREYFDSLRGNLPNIIFGSPTATSDYFYMRLYRGNLHNAFLMLHSKFGIVGTCLMLYGLGKAVFIFIKQKKRAVLLVIFIAVFRSFFDWIAFPGYYDFIFFFIMINADNIIYHRRSDIV